MHDEKDGPALAGWSIAALAAAALVTVAVVHTRDPDPVERGIRSDAPSAERSEERSAEQGAASLDTQRNVEVTRNKAAGLPAEGNPFDVPLNVVVPGRVIDRLTNLGVAGAEVVTYQSHSLPSTRRNAQRFNIGSGGAWVLAGAPSIGDHVLLWREEADHVIERVVTDEEGRFEIARTQMVDPQPGEWIWIRVSHPSYADATFFLARNTSVLIPLDAGAVIRGVVDGLGQDEATLDFVSDGVICASAEVSRSGGFEARLPGGRKCRPHISTRGLRLLPPVEPFIVEPMPPLRLRVQRVPLLHVVDAADGGPLERYRVRVLAAEGMCLSDEPVDSRDGVCEVGSLDDVRKWMEMRCSLQILARERKVARVALREGLLDYRVEMEPGADALRCRIVRGDVGVAGAQVAVAVPPRLRWFPGSVQVHDEQVSDETGHCDFPSAGETMLCRVIDLDGAETWWMLSGAGFVELDLDALGTVLITWRDGECPDEVEVHETTTMRTREFRALKGETSLLCTTPPGEVEVVARRRGATVAQERVLVPAGEQRVVEVFSDPIAERHARVRVVGELLSESWGVLVDGREAEMDTATGEIHRDLSSGGRVRVTDGRCTWLFSVPERASDNDLNLVVDLSGGSRTGSVVNAEGDPVLDLDITARLSDDGVVRAVTDRDGRWRVPLPSGSALESVTFRYEEIRCTVVVGEGEVEVRVPSGQEPWAEVRGRVDGVARRSGALVKGWIEQRIGDGQHAMQWAVSRSTARTDDEGRFQLQLPNLEGCVMLRVRSDGEVEQASFGPLAELPDLCRVSF